MHHVRKFALTGCNIGVLLVIIAPSCTLTTGVVVLTMTTTSIATRTRMNAGHGNEVVRVALGLILCRMLGSLCVHCWAYYASGLG